MTELEQLREDVRATAPQARPDFAARLERRVEAGFKQAKAPKRERRKVNLFAPALALACTALIAIVVGLASLDTGGDDEAESGASGGDAPAQVAEPEVDRSSGGSADDSLPAPSASSAPYAAQDAGAAPERRRRVVERRTALELETGADEFSEVTAGVLRVADDTDSIVQRSSVTEREGKGFATYDLRVPASQLDDALAELSRLADVTSRTASSDDITGAYVSASDRLEDARGERRALLKALEKADTDAEAESLRRQIQLARGRIAAAERDVRALQARANRAKVSVTVQSTGRKTEGGAWTPGDALDDAGRILEVAAGVILVTAAALLPLAILAALAAVAARVLRRRKREAALGP